MGREGSREQFFSPGFPLTCPPGADYRRAGRARRASAACPIRSNGVIRLTAALGRATTRQHDRKSRTVPYDEYPGYAIPQEQDAPIWRYMDLAKLLDILVRKALFFPSAHKLREMDPFEGQLTYSDLELASIDPGKAADEQIQKEGFSNRAEFEALVGGHRSVAGAIGWVAKTHFINCWHMNDDESDAMWKIYVPSRDGVAIRSSFARLKGAFAPTPENAMIGMVRYESFDKVRTETPYDVLNFYMRKRASFSHERELRAVIKKMGAIKSYVNADGTRGTKEKHDSVRLVPQALDAPGISVTVDLNTLIDKIVVAPTADKWFSELVTSLIEKLCFKFEVIPSELSRKPAWSKPRPT
jgi:hypothetical protein